jgi:Holliday junction resolvase RusA-like endonuclease
VSLPLVFWVDEPPVTKQSFRCRNNGKGYQTARVKSWQEAVAISAKNASPGIEPTGNRIQVELDFYLPDRRRRDCENLSKGVMDALEGIIFVNDEQCDDLHIRKFYKQSKVGAMVRIDYLKENQ